MYVLFQTFSFVFLIVSRVDTYTIDLPSNLPPTFKGRAMRFSYQLVVGTCRASSGLASGSSSGGGGGNVQTSRVMRVPIRVYNHVSGGCGYLCVFLYSFFVLIYRLLVDFPSQPYDILWPVSKRREKAVVGVTQDVEKDNKEIRGGGNTGNGTYKRRAIDALLCVSPGTVSNFNFMHSVASLQSTTLPPDPTFNEALQSLKSYANKLLANDPALEENNERESLNDISSNSAGQVEKVIGGLTGCREAVEIITRNTRKSMSTIIQSLIRLMCPFYQKCLTI